MRSMAWPAARKSILSPSPAQTSFMAISGSSFATTRWTRGTSSALRCRRCGSMSLASPSVVRSIFRRFTTANKNKTFFFGAMEWQRISRGTTATATVPTAAMRTGDYSGLKDHQGSLTGEPFPGNIIPESRIDANAAAYAALYPLPNLPGTGVNYVSNPWTTSNLRQELIRVDHQLTAKNLLTFRGSDDYYVYIQPGNALGYDTYRHSTLYTFGIALHTTFSPRY